MAKKSILEDYNIKDSVSLVAATDKDLIKFAEKWENFIMKTIKEANELHREGSNLIAADVLLQPVSRERNRFLLSRLGAIKGVVSTLLAVYEAARRET